MKKYVKGNHTPINKSKISHGFLERDQRAGNDLVKE